MRKVSDINVTTCKPLPSPQEVMQAIDKSESHQQFVAEAREQIHDIIFGSDKRMLFVVGPCSIHDVETGKDYAKKLVALADKVKDRIFIVMRAYFEKPRTSIGWKGLIMDPQLDGSYDIPAGLKMARTFLQDIVDLGLPTATELLDPITPQYISDYICWSCIGARTTESQTHRQMASGLSMPLGFKNSTDGSITAAINAIKAASSQQTFLGIDSNGGASAVTTKGNPNCHIVLRGGNSGPNYSPDHIKEASKNLTDAKLCPSVMIDCSHGNSNKDFQRQPEVLSDLIEQALTPNSPIIGAMLESNIHAGSQAFPQPKEDLKYGVSITDGCIDFETTERIILESYEKLAPRV